MTIQHPMPKGAETAETIVNRMSEKDLADIFFRYGEERFSRRIAHAIVRERARKPIKTSKELADIISNAVGRRGKRHPATRVFQALRIVVNDELGALTDAIAEGVHRLSPGGRIAIISFQSMEDRIVKHMFRDLRNQAR
jgi:16S rRNA (cytosine1402-N4)-methyltransferase